MIQFNDKSFLLRQYMILAQGITSQSVNKKQIVVKETASYKYLVYIWLFFSLLENKLIKTFTSTDNYKAQLPCLHH